jgi:hypothetical protein
LLDPGIVLRVGSKGHTPSLRGNWNPIRRAGIRAIDKPLKTLAAQERDELSTPEQEVVLAELHRKEVIELLST